MIKNTLFFYNYSHKDVYKRQMLNGFYYLPMNIVGFYMWRKQKDDAGTVIVRRLTPKQIILLIIGLLIAITAYWRVLVALGGNLQLIRCV